MRNAHLLESPHTITKKHQIEITNNSLKKNIAPSKPKAHFVSKKMKSSKGKKFHTEPPILTQSYSIPFFSDTSTTTNFTI